MVLGGLWGWQPARRFTSLGSRGRPARAASLGVRFGEFYFLTSWGAGNQISAFWRVKGREEVETGSAIYQEGWW